jgi:hypothetical protein
MFSTIRSWVRWFCRWGREEEGKWAGEDPEDCISLTPPISRTDPINNLYHMSKTGKTYHPRKFRTQVHLSPYRPPETE